MTIYKYHSSKCSIGLYNVYVVCCNIVIIIVIVIKSSYLHVCMFSRTQSFNCTNLVDMQFYVNRHFIPTRMKCNICTILYSCGKLHTTVYVSVAKVIIYSRKVVTLKEILVFQISNIFLVIFCIYNNFTSHNQILFGSTEFKLQKMMLYLAWSKISLSVM